MYLKGAIVQGVAGASALAYTGLNAAWTVVAVMTLVFAGLALVKLTPRRSL